MLLKTLGSFVRLRFDFPFGICHRICGDNHEWKMQRRQQVFR
jgi:hypothetical protein